MNAATRLRNLLEAAAQHKSDENHHAIQTWMMVLRRPSDTQAIAATEISRRLVAFIDQADLLEEALHEREVPPHVFQNDLKLLKASLSPDRSREPWKNVKPGLSGTVLTMLRWADWATGEHETPLCREDLDSIRAGLNDLQASLEQDGVPPSLRRVVRRHVKDLEDAVADYDLTGVQPLQRAMHSVAGGVVAEKEVFSAASRSENAAERAVVDTVLTTMSKTGEILDKAGKHAGSIKAIWAVGKELFRIADQ